VTKLNKQAFAKRNKIGLVFVVNLYHFWWSLLDWWCQSCRLHLFVDRKLYL